MIQNIKNKLLALFAITLFAVPLAVPAISSAATIQGSLCGGANTLAIDPADQPASTCTDTGDGGTSKVNEIIRQVINIFSVIVGVIAVIMIIVGGFRYITSGGDSTKVTGAKNTILYALIGLIIVALSQIIVKFVLNKTV